MTDLEKLTSILGTPEKTAKELGVGVRSYWNYRGGRIPAPIRKLISLKLSEVQTRVAKALSEST